MLIRLDECHSFGMKKNNTKSVQYLPKVYINNELVKPIKPGESFLYLGRHYYYDTSEKEHKNTLRKNLKELLEKWTPWTYIKEQDAYLPEICSRYYQLGPRSN